MYIYIYIYIIRPRGLSRRMLLPPQRSGPQFRYFNICYITNINTMCGPIVLIITIIIIITNIMNTYPALYLNQAVGSVPL